ncbi:hypothetical protein [Microtetraspora malaysiensis]|uniref:hypothetical protein n=1 Tax=Microtetraspora malaysiensis TaxID=161358 RepID=UPI003D8FBB60
MEQPFSNTFRDVIRICVRLIIDFLHSESLTVTALEAIWAHDGEVVNRDGRLVLTPDKSAVDFDQNARDALKDLADSCRGKDPEDSVAFETAALQAFTSGRAGVMRNWPVAYEKLAHGVLHDDATVRRPADVDGGRLRGWPFRDAVAALV